MARKSLVSLRPSWMERTAKTVPQTASKRPSSSKGVLYTRYHWYASRTAVMNMAKHLPVQEPIRPRGGRHKRTGSRMKLDQPRRAVIFSAGFRHGGEPVSTRATNLSAHAGPACGSSKNGQRKKR